jgi:hypothetical protein
VLADLVARAVRHDEDAIEELAELAAEDAEPLAPYLFQLLDADVYTPQVIFRGADEEFQRELIAEIERGDSHRPHVLLYILAWIRSPLAEAAFRRWAEHPPPDAEWLSGVLFLFTRTGGWEIRDGRVKELCGADAYELLLDDDDREPSSEHCPWCDSPLWTVLDVDTADAAVAQALAHTGWQGRLRVVTCFLCSCHGTTYSDVAPDGTASWSPHNERPEFTGTEPETPPALTFTVGERLPTPYMASAWEEDGSTLGGHPDWIQEPEYPGCPVCGQVMDYVGLVGGSDVGDLVEGANYLFLHTGCKLAAVVYQQS